MRAGRLMHRVVVCEDLESLDDATNEVVYTPTTVATRWAEIEPVAGNERTAAARVHADTTHKVRLRYFTGLTTKHWFLYGTRRLEILSVVDVGEGKSEHVCECREVV